MIKQPAKILLSFLFSSIAIAAVPKDLMFNNQPIDALCFFNLDNHSPTMNLNECGLKKSNYSNKGLNEQLISKGYIGYDWQDPEFHGETQGYIYYKYFKAGDHSYWLYTLNSGGGTGNFTSIQLVKRTGEDTLDVKNIAGGDRCNGGLQNVSEKNTQLTFSVNITAFDLISLAKNHHSSIKSYDDLAACAVCCVAKAFYVVGPNAQPKLLHVDLGHISKTEELPQQGTHQSCFNTLYASYVAKGNLKLKTNQIDEFMDKFKLQCLEEGS